MSLACILLIESLLIIKQYVVKALYVTYNFIFYSVKFNKNIKIVNFTIKSSLH